MFCLFCELVGSYLTCESRYQCQHGNTTKFQPIYMLNIEEIERTFVDKRERINRLVGQTSMNLEEKREERRKKGGGKERGGVEPWPQSQALTLSKDWLPPKRSRGLGNCGTMT